jgi:hypothetical protein
MIPLNNDTVLLKYIGEGETHVFTIHKSDLISHLDLHIDLIEKYKDSNNFILKNSNIVKTTVLLPNNKIISHHGYGFNSNKISLVLQSTSKVKAVLDNGSLEYHQNYFYSLNRFVNPVNQYNFPVVVESGGGVKIEQLGELENSANKLTANSIIYSKNFNLFFSYKMHAELFSLKNSFLIQNKNGFFRKVFETPCALTQYFIESGELTKDEIKDYQNNWADLTRGDRTTKLAILLTAVNMLEEASTTKINGLQIDNKNNFIALYSNTNPLPQEKIKFVESW